MTDAEWYDPDCTESGCNGHHSWATWPDGERIVRHTLVVSDAEFQAISDLIGPDGSLA